MQTFPSETFRQGNFSSLLPTVQLYDPTTHQPIPGNILSNDPNYKPSAVMGKVFGLLPPTNGAPSNNTLVNSVSFTRANLFDVKVDEAISDKQRISASFDYDNTSTGGTESIGPFFGQTTPQNTRYARFADYYIFTPNVFNQFLAGFTRRFRGEFSNSIGGNYPQKLGITGVQNTTFPCFNFQSNPVGQALSNCGDSVFADNTFQFDDAVTWIHGRHNFMFGGETRLMQFNVRRLTQSSGGFTFAPDETGLPGVANTGDAIASALFGIVHSSVLVYGAFSGIRYKNNAVYAQDSFKIRPKLTLNYGLRYDFDVPATESHNRFSDVDPTLPNPGAGNIPGAYTYFGSGPGRNGKTRPQNIYTKDFAPRVGFAYGFNDKTVIRGGYGIYYEPLKEGSFADQDSLGFFNSETLQTGNGAPFQIDNGMPHLVPPTGPLTPQGQNGNGGVILVPPDVKPAQIQNWNLDVQRQITKNLLVSVAYVGSKGTFLPALNIIPNQVNPSFLSLGNDLTMNVSCLTNGSCPAAIAAGVRSPYSGFTGTLAQALRPFPQYGDFNQEDNSFTPDRTGSSIYHAMQVSVTQRLSQGLSFLVSYTVSKDITNAESMGQGAGGFIGDNSYIGQNSYDRAAEKSLSELDTPQSLTYSFVYQLPLGSGQRFMNHLGYADRLAKGWYVAGIGSYSSGNPLVVYTSCSGTAGQILFAGCEFTGAARVNLVPGVPETNKGSNFQPASTPFYNINAFSLPAPFTFGNEGRTLPHARGFTAMNENFTLGKKTFLYGERVGIDFRAEFFNIFNRHIYQAPVGAPVGGTPFTVPFEAAESPGCPSPFACGFGAVTSASGPRNIQFSMRVTF
ncbi:MAG: TonB-dependent receptor domain-containing protein [Terriglobia bacterium]